MRLTPLIEIEETRKFFVGTTLRFYYEGEKFYDYLLASAPWEQFITAVNITNNDIKKGYVYSGTLAVNNESGEFVVTKKNFQHTFGNLEDWFLLED